MSDNPFEKFNAYVENIDQQPVEVQDFFSDVQNLLEDSVIASKVTQKSFIGQYIDNYDVEAKTALNDSLDLARYSVADMMLYLAASCVDQGEPLERSFADQVRALAVPYEEEADQGAGWQVREYNAVPFNEAARRIKPGVSHVTNVIQSLFLNDFSRRMDAHVGLDNNLRLVADA